MGRPKKVKSPEILWENFQKYRTLVKSKPFIVKDWVGKDAEMVLREKEKPLTIEGFECFLSDNDIITDFWDYTHYPDFSDICSRIRREVRLDQIAGGMAGIYNPSITQRLNGLVEKTQNEVTINTPTILDTTEPAKPDA